MLVTNALRATNGAAIDADADYATIKTRRARRIPAPRITDARLQRAVRPGARALRRRPASRGVNPGDRRRVVRSFTTQSVRHGAARHLGARSRPARRLPPLVLPVPVATTGAITGRRAEPREPALRARSRCLTT